MSRSSKNLSVTCGRPNNQIDFLKLCYFHIICIMDILRQENIRRNTAYLLNLGICENVEKFKILNKCKSRSYQSVTVDYG